jgi:hypothetical protein
MSRLKLELRIDNAVLVILKIPELLDVLIPEGNHFKFLNAVILKVQVTLVELKSHHFILKEFGLVKLKPFLFNNFSFEAANLFYIYHD